MIEKMYSVLVFIMMLTEVESRVCYFKSSEFVKYFYCSPHQYCCADACCQSYMRLSFYRLWYFWLTVIMVLIFCSGSGYWFRRRYRPELIGNSGGLVLHRETRQEPRDTSSRVPDIGARVMPPPSYSLHGAPVQAPGYAAYQMYGPPPSYEAVYPTNPQGPPAYTANAGVASPTGANVNNSGAK